MNQIANLLKKFALESSFHGVNHLFGPRLFRNKILWTLISLTFICFWFYYLSLSLHEFFVNKPTVTEIKQEYNKEITMPSILVCPVLTNISAFEAFFPGNIGPLFTYLLFLSQHPMMETFRTSLSQNISEALQKFPNVEKQWSFVYNQLNFDENLARIYGNFEFTTLRKLTKNYLWPRLTRPIQNGQSNVASDRF